MPKPQWRISCNKLIHHQAWDAASGARTRAQRNAQPHICLHLLSFSVMTERVWEGKTNKQTHNFYQLAVDITQAAEQRTFLQNGLTKNTSQRGKPFLRGSYVFTCPVCNLPLSPSLVRSISNQGRAHSHVHIFLAIKPLGPAN